MCLQSTDRPIDELYVQPLSPPDARTVLLPESDKCRAYTPAIHRPTNSANTPAITTQPNDRADTPAIQRPIDRSSSECSTYYHHLMLAPHCHQNWHLAALPTAAYLGITILYFHNLSAAYLSTTILWFYFILLEYMDKSYIVTYLGTAVLRTKKELPVSEYKDRSYIVTRRRHVVDVLS